MAAGHPRLLFAAALLASLAPARAAEERWSLFSREGGCFELATLKRKFRDLPDVRTPQAFVTYLESKRLRYTQQPLALPRGRAVEVRVPDAELGLVFVTAENCETRPAEGR